MNSKKFPASDDGEQHDAHWYAEQAMQPRTKDGLQNLFIYLIPVEDAPTRDGLVSPFIRLIQAAEPSRIKDGLEEPLCFPHWRTDMKGPVSPIFSDADFEGGKIPEDLEYCPGHEEWGIMPNGERFRRVVYSDPVLNLSPMDQESLRRGRELEEREALTYTPPPGLPSYQPAPYISGAMPPQFVLPVHVWSHNDGMVATSDDKSELLSNYSVGVKERHVVVEREEQKREEVVLEVNCNGERYLLTVKAEELGHLAPIISKRFPSCHTNEDASKASARIENYIREQLSSVPKVTIIRSPGFFQIGKCWVYAHDAAISPDPSIVFKTGCTIPCDHSMTAEQALKRILHLLGLSNASSVMLPMLLIAHLGPMYRLFEEAGYPPRFVGYIVGQTGSLKTSTALCVFRLFEEQPQTPEASFRDTQTALEVKIGDAQSRVLLVDDFQPAVTAAAGKANLEKLEFLVRLFGDGVAKARSNAELGRAKEFHPAGCCVVTGEDTGGSHSSLLRCLILPVEKGEINGQRLKEYQDHPEYLFTHFWHFLNWCGERGDDIIGFVQQEFQREREYFSAYIKEPRQADIGATLMLVAEIFLKYVAAVAPRYSPDDAKINQTFREAIIQTLQRNEVETQERDPVDMYLTALFDLEAAGKVWIAPNPASFKTGHHIGFAKDEAWWLLPSEVFAKVARYWKEQGVVFPLKSGKVHALLAGKTLIRTTQENRQGKLKQMYLLKSTLEGRPRMLVLYVDQARKYLELKTN